VSAIGRLALLHFTMLPLQRLLAPAGVVLLFMGGPLALVGAPAMPVLAFGGLLILFPMSIAAGLFFRTLAAARSRQLLPLFRVRLLAATVLVVMSSAAVVAAFVRATSEMTGAEAFVYSAFVLSLLLWIMVLASGGSLRLALLLALALLAGGGLLDWAVPSGTQQVAAVAIALSVGWGIFCLWHLRPVGARRSVAVLEGANTIAGRRLRLPETLSARDAAIACLWECPGPRRRQWLQTSGLLALLGTLIMLAGGSARGLLAASFVAVPGVILPSVTQTARRARLVWLKVSMSRVELLRAIETELLKRELPNLLISVSVLLAVPKIVLDIPVSGLAAIALCVITTGMLGACLALMWVRPFRAWEVTVGAAYFISLAVAAISALLDPIREHALIWIAVVQLAAVLPCRAIALGRWQTLDWLEVRVERKPRGGADTRFAGWRP
jgi:hypothetical protein